MCWASYLLAQQQRTLFVTPQTHFPHLLSHPSSALMAQVFTTNGLLNGTLYLHELLHRGGRYAPPCVEVDGRRMTPSQAEVLGGCASVRDWRFSLKTLYQGKVISLNHLLKAELKVEGETGGSKKESGRAKEKAATGGARGALSPAARLAVGEVSQDRREGG